MEARRDSEDERMTIVLIRKLLRDVRWGLAVIALLLFGFQIFWVKATERVTTQVAPMFQVMARSQNKKIEDVEKQLFRGPGRVMQSVIGGDQLKFEKAQDVLSIGYVHPIIQILFCLWAIGRAAGAIAGEIDRGTMELLLAQPLPRSRVILAHLCVDALLIPALCLSLWGGLWAGIAFVGELKPDIGAFKDFPLAIKEVDPALLKMNADAFGPPLVNVAAFLFAVSGLTMWLSAAGRYRSRVIGIAIVLILVQFVMNIVGQIWDNVSFFRPLSLFYYYQPQQIVLHGSWSVPLEPIGLTAQVPMLAVLAGVGLAGYAMAFRVFQRRDLPAPL
jgi:beta-exotoxin I transport system permease protein